jgi:hypothetical protein
MKTLEQFEKIRMDYEALKQKLNPDKIQVNKIPEPILEPRFRTISHTLNLLNHDEENFKIQLNYSCNY